MKKASLPAIVSVIMLNLFVLGLACAQTQPPPQPAPLNNQPPPSTQTLSLEEQDKIAKKDHKLRPLIDAPGTDCLDYQVDVVKLTANNTQMFWKQSDCIRIHVTNNPFLFKWSISVDETKIPEDDLSPLTKALGVNVSTPNSTGVNSDKPSKDKVKEQTSTVVAVTDHSVKLAGDNATLAEYAATPAGKKSLVDIPAMRNVLSEMVIAGSRGDLNSMQDAAKGLNQVKGLAKEQGKVKPDQPDATLQPVVRDIQATLPETISGDQLSQWKGTVSQLKAGATSIDSTLVLMKKEYDRFASTVPDSLSELVNLDAPIATVQAKAHELNSEAKSELKCLTDGILNYGGDGIYSCPGGSNAINVEKRTLEERLVDFARTGAGLHQALQPYLDSTDPRVAQAATDVSNELHTAGERVVKDACIDQGMRDHDLSSITSGIITPLDGIKSDAFSYGYPYPQAAKKREGPWADPESVTLTLTRENLNPFASTSGNSKTPVNTTSSFSCSSDTTDMFENGDTYSRLSDFFTDKPVKGQTNTYTRNQNKPTTTGTTSGPTPVSTNGSGSGNTGGKNAGTGKSAVSADGDSTVLVQPWFFGKARLVLTGGLATALLSKQEFQRSSAITGTSSETVIGLKTNTKLRISPMLYGHTLLPFISGRHDPGAWYATLGVTANSDSKGTSPEFLLGFSRSLVQQKCFITAGAYIGERQKLDGGLYVGEVIPSTFTSDLPVTKSYHVGFSFGISYRFASSKDPQSNTKSKQPSSGGNKTKTSN